jgi:hypothetical protein
VREAHADVTSDCPAVTGEAFLPGCRNDPSKEADDDGNPAHNPFNHPLMPREEIFGPVLAVSCFEDCDELASYAEIKNVHVRFG